MSSALHVLGLSRRAGKLAIGEEAVHEAVSQHSARLVVAARDGAEKTLSRGEALCRREEVPWMALPFSKEELGGAVGRGVCAVMAVTDAGLAAAFARRMAEEDLRFAALAEELDSRAQRARARQKARQAQKRAAEKRTRKPWAAPPSPDKGRQTGKKTGPKGTGRHP